MVAKGWASPTPKSYRRPIISEHVLGRSAVTLFYPAPTSGGTLIHLLAIHIHSNFSAVVVYVYIGSVIYKAPLRSSLYG